MAMSMLANHSAIYLFLASRVCSWHYGGDTEDICMDGDYSHLHPWGSKAVVYIFYEYIYICKVLFLFIITDVVKYKVTKTIASYVLYDRSKSSLSQPWAPCI